MPSIQTPLLQPDTTIIDGGKTGHHSVCIEQCKKCPNIVKEAQYPPSTISNDVNLHEKFRYICNAQIVNSYNQNNYYVYIGGLNTIVVQLHHICYVMI
jgi:hypothetical protein